MRNFRIVAMAYEETAPKNERVIKKIIASFVMKIEYPDEMIIHFTGWFDEEKIKEKLEQVRMLCQRDDQSLGIIVFESLKYNPYWFGLGMSFKI